MAYRLYIIMRTDMASMNAGKAMAHAAHAANDFEDRIQKYIKKHDEDEWLVNRYLDWKEDRSFGTTLVFGGKENDIMTVTGSHFEDGMSGLVIDPTYPIRDGEIVHHISIMTCGWVFCDEDEWKSNPNAASLSLHP